MSGATQIRERRVVPARDYAASQPPRKLSKWDRPPPPKDWRYFVGGLGKTLITLGLLTFGFVAYQLWGTGIETARAQNQLGSEFEAALPVAATETTDTTVAPVAAAELPEALQPTDPNIAEVATEQAQAPLLKVPNSAIMKIEIPKIGVESYILPTVGRTDLEKGVGHFPETPWAGQLGNVALAGHRTTYGGPFYHLDELAPGDRITITRIDGNRYVYQVTGSRVVSPNGYDVIGDYSPDRATLMLVTCTPVRTATNRLIVEGELIADESDVVGVPTFYTINKNAEIEAANAEIEAANAEAAGTSEPASSTPVDDEPAITDPANATGGVDTSVAPDFDPVPNLSEDSEITESSDGWERGWFEDGAAWPQIALWGGALLALWALARIIARMTRHTSFGVLAVIAPFVVSLYFFYQNINRLLPPGI